MNFLNTFEHHLKNKSLSDVVHVRMLLYACVCEEMCVFCLRFYQTQVTPNLSGSSSETCCTETRNNEREITSGDFCKC